MVHKFLLGGDKLMPEMHLEKPGFTYSACDPFTKNKEKIQIFMQTENTVFIYKNDFDKACFQHDMAYGKYKDFPERTQSDRVLRDKAFIIVKTRGLVQWFTSFLIKNLKTVVSLRL